MTPMRPMSRARAFFVRMAETAAAAFGPSRGIPSADGRRRIFFVVHNKNHMSIFSGFVGLLEARGVSVHFASIGGHRNQGQALGAIAAANRQALDIGDMARMATPDDLICLGNDWGPRRLVRLLERLKARGVPTVAVVEGARFAFPRHYKHVDELLCWGPSGHDIGARRTRIVGSPVIEKAARLPRTSHDRPRVLVNYKFSGTAQDNGFAWGAAAIAAAREIDPDFVLSTHPSSRDVPADVTVSHAPFHDLLQEATLVITKASTVIHEALAAGVAVLYFPAPDEARAEFGDPRGAFETGESASDLLAAARRYAAHPVFPAAAAQAFLDRHVSIDPAASANARIAAALIKTLAARGDLGTQSQPSAMDGLPGAAVASSKRLQA